MQGRSQYRNGLIEDQSDDSHRGRYDFPIGSLGIFSNCGDCRDQFFGYEGTRWTVAGTTLEAHSTPGESRAGDIQNSRQA